MPLVFDRTLGELSTPRLDRRLAAAATDRRVRLDDLFSDALSQWTLDEYVPNDGASRSCVVAIDTGVCTPAVLTIRDDGEWLLWLRMPRTTWQQRKSSPAELWTRRLSNDDANRLLGCLQPSIADGSGVLHPHLVSTLLGILNANQTLFDTILGESEPSISSVRLRLVALPPQPPALEQCLTVLTHRKAFVVSEEDDEADVPLTQRITDHVVWGAPSNGAANAALAKTFNDEYANLQSLLKRCSQPSVSLAHVLGPASVQNVAMEALVRYVTQASAPVAAAPTMMMSPSKTSGLAPSDDDDDDDPRPRVVPTFPKQASSSVHTKTVPKKRKRKDDSDDSDDDDDASESSSVSGVSEEEDDDSEEDDDEENEPAKDDDSERTTVHAPTAPSHRHDAERLATVLKTHGESFSKLRRDAALAACQQVAKGESGAYGTLLSYAVGFLEDAMEERRPDSCVLVPAAEAAAARAAATRLLTHTERELPAVAQTLATLTAACGDAALVLKQDAMHKS